MDAVRLSRKRLVIFLIITFTLTFLYEFLVVIPLANDPEAAIIGAATALVSGAMLIPAISSVLTRLITKEGFKDIWLKPVFKERRWIYYIIAWFAPSLLCIAGAAVYFIARPESFDPAMGYFRMMLESQGVDLTESSFALIVVSQFALGIFASPLLNIVFCLGEELGWRGYMAPKFIESGVKILPSLLIGNVLWGLWHAPLIWGLGHNYGVGYAGFPYAGIAMMCVMCLATGTLFTWLAFKTKNALPAALAHGALNGTGSIGLLGCASLQYYDPFVGPAPTGILGCSVFLIVAVVLALMLRRDEKKGCLICSPPAEEVKQGAVNPSGFTKESFGASEEKQG